MSRSSSWVSARCDDEGVEPLGERMYAAVKVGTYGVGRMWSQRRYNAGMTAPTRDELFGLGQGSIGTAGVSDVEVGVRQNPAHTQLIHHRRNLIFIEIHVA